MKSLTNQIHRRMDNKIFRRVAVEKILAAMPIEAAVQLDPVKTTDKQWMQIIRGLSNKVKRELLAAAGKEPVNA